MSDTTVHLKKELQGIVDDLLQQAGLSRTTIRVNVPSLGVDTTRPIVEARMPGVSSLMDKVRTNQDKAGTVNFLKRERRLLLQEDTKNADPGAVPPAALHDEYGTLAQMLAGMWLNDELIGWVSAHENRRTRRWTQDEAAMIQRAAERALAVITPIARQT